MVSEIKGIFPAMQNSIFPSLKLQAQITERDLKKLTEAVNKSPTMIAGLKLRLKKAKLPSNPDTLNIKELTRQC